MNDMGRAKMETAKAYVWGLKNNQLKITKDTKIQNNM